MYGLTTPTSEGGQAPAKKATRFMTNSVHMSRQLCKVCDGSHIHQHLIGGRCAAAAFYPMPLVRAILSGMRDQSEHDRRSAQDHRENHERIAAVSDSAGRIPTEDNSTTIPTSSIKKSSGGSLPINYLPNQFKPKYIDEYTGQVLDPTMAQAAVMEELNDFNDHVWEISTKEEMAQVEGHILVRSRWVCCNKGDEESPDIRCRLVACEINKGDRPDNFFASTPPLEEKKLLFARFAQERKRWEIS